MSDVRDLVFGPCQTCLRPICQCPAKPTPSTDAQAMTREEFERTVYILSAGNVPRGGQVLAHDAAQRETIRRLEASEQLFRNEMDKMLDKLASILGKPRNEVGYENGLDQLQARLTASEAALRDCLALARRRQRTDMAEDWSHIIRFCDQAGIKPDGTLRQGPLTPEEEE